MYRKWRPVDFRDLYGQNLIRHALINALKEEKLSHAYIFAGPRGVGKTSVARILARYINCTNLKDGRACGSCDNCQDYLSGRALDLLEIDAASNRGIDDIRDLIEKIKFAPTKSKYKVFIVDEAHMLTREAWNALLKTLEEPPRHALFILVTTEPQKIPTTIHSRCQRFDFKRISKKEITKRLEEICKQEKINIKEDSIELIAENAKGGLRDAISLLDQIQSFVGKDINVEDIQLVLGLGDERLVRKFLDALIQKDAKQSLKVIEEVLREGHDLESFVKNSIEELRKLLVAKLKISEILEQNFGEEKTQEYLKRVEKIELKELVCLIKILIKANLEMRQADILELPLELLVLEYAYQEDESAGSNQQTAKSDQSVAVTKSQKGKKFVLPNSLIEIQNNWIHFLEALKPYNHSLYSLIKTTAPVDFKDNQLILATNFKFHKDRINEAKNRELVAKVAEKIFGKAIGFKAKIYTTEEKPKVDRFFEWLKNQTSKADKKLEQEIGEVFET